MRYIPILFLAFVMVLPVSCDRNIDENADEVHVAETPDPRLLRVEAASMVLPDEIRLAFMAAFHADREAFYSLLEAASRFSEANGNLMVLVDKKHSLGEDYEPKDLVLLDRSGLAVNKAGMYLRNATLDALRELIDAAGMDGHKLVIGSAYRSYSYQDGLFDYYVKNYGPEEAARWSARPGQSQHQLGTVVDFMPIDDSFGRSPAGRWVAGNAHAYGFSQSFPPGMEEVTGYIEESWHWRWLGKDAVEVQRAYFQNVQQYMLEFYDEWIKN